MICQRLLAGRFQIGLQLNGTVRGDRVRPWRGDPDLMTVKVQCGPCFLLVPVRHGPHHEQSLVNARSGRAGPVRVRVSDGHPESDHDRDQHPDQQHQWSPNPPAPGPRFDDVGNAVLHPASS